MLLATAGGFLAGAGEIFLQWVGNSVARAGGFVSKRWRLRSPALMGVVLVSPRARNYHKSLRLVDTACIKTCLWRYRILHAYAVVVIVGSRASSDLYG